MRMNDIHQALRPVYVHLTFGSSAISANLPRIGIGIGTGSTGSGALTGGVGSSNCRALSEGTGISNVFSYTSCEPDRAGVVIFDQSLNPNYVLHFLIERGRTADGAIDRDTVYFVHSATGGPLTHSQVFNINGGAHGIEQTALCCVVAPTNQRASQETYGMGLVLPIGPNAVVMRPATGYIITNVNDHALGAVAEVYVYGEKRRYRKSQNIIPTFNYGGGANHIVWFRFD